MLNAGKHRKRKRHDNVYDEKGCVICVRLKRTFNVHASVSLGRLPYGLTSVDCCSCSSPSSVRLSVTDVHDDKHILAGTENLRLVDSHVTNFRVFLLFNDALLDATGIVEMTRDCREEREKNGK